MDIHQREIYPAVITIIKGIIAEVTRTKEGPFSNYILPGLIDAHIHIESSMVTPGAFAITAVRHGTTGVVSDPHEIANVLGIKGVEYMMDDAAKVPLRFWFGAPSCVPATEFETSGAKLDSEDIRNLMKKSRIKYLSEMMNYPGVIKRDKEIMKKIGYAQRYGKPVDGHAPGLSGKLLKKYAQAGISTDHECSTLEEAEEKIRLGMKILIREGSAAANLDALKSLFRTAPGKVMLCSDDLHPEMLKFGHINKLVAKLINEKYDIFDVIRSATINPVRHYGLEAGLLKEGDNADFIVTDNLDRMNIIETWIGGQKVFTGNEVCFDYLPGKCINNFIATSLKIKDIAVRNTGNKIRVIEARDGDLLTGDAFYSSGNEVLVETDPEEDLLKIVVKDRYKDAKPAVGFIKGFGLKEGAFASSIAHDSHNIIAVGTNDRDIVNSVNEIIKLKGGLAVVSGKVSESLQLDIGGIMTTRSCDETAESYNMLNKLVSSLGCTMAAPFMTLSFMALLVIPSLKIGDKGLFDVNKFQPVSLFV